MKQSSESEQKKAEQMLLESFHRGKTFVDALAKIEQEITLISRSRSMLQAKWDVWETFGGPDD